MKNACRRHESLVLLVISLKREINFKVWIYFPLLWNIHRERIIYMLYLYSICLELLYRMVVIATTASLRSGVFFHSVSRTPHNSIERGTTYAPSPFLCIWRKYSCCIYINQVRCRRTYVFVYMYRSASQERCTYILWTTGSLCYLPRKYPRRTLYSR